MDILLGAPDLAKWEARPIWPAIAEGPRERDPRDRHRRDVAVEPPGEPVPRGPFERAAAAIMRFDVFPPRVITGVLRRTPVDIGDTVGARYRGFRVFDVFFAARVIATFRGALGELHRAGFTYQTLVGHPELGEETFCVEKHLPTGRVSVELSSWSRPAILVSRALSPLVRRLQLRGGRSALDHLAAIAVSTG
jgi:uncharacterized protein (UPF0548 family)